MKFFLMILPVLLFTSTFAQEADSQTTVDEQILAVPQPENMLPPKNDTNQQTEELKKFFFKYSFFRVTGEQVDFESDKQINDQDILQIDSSEFQVNSLPSSLTIGYNESDWGYEFDIDLDEENKSTEAILYRIDKNLYYGAGLSLELFKNEQKIRSLGSTLSDTQKDNSEISLIAYAKNEIINNSAFLLDAELRLIGGYMLTKTKNKDTNVSFKIYTIGLKPSISSYFKLNEQTLIGSSIAFAYGRFSGKLASGSLSERGTGDIWAYQFNLIQIKKYF